MNKISLKFKHFSKHGEKNGSNISDYFFSKWKCFKIFEYSIVIWLAFIECATFQWLFIWLHSVCFNQFLHTFDNKIELGFTNWKKVSKKYFFSWFFFCDFIVKTVQSRIYCNYLVHQHHWQIKHIFPRSLSLAVCAFVSLYIFFFQCYKCVYIRILGCKLSIFIVHWLPFWYIKIYICVCVWCYFHINHED